MTWELISNVVAVILFSFVALNKNIKQRTFLLVILGFGTVATWFQIFDIAYKHGLL